MFDDIIKNKINSHEAPVPPDAWNNIVQQKRKRRFGLFWWSSIVLLLCSLAVTGYLLTKKSSVTVASADDNNYSLEKKSSSTGTSPDEIKQPAGKTNRPVANTTIGEQSSNNNAPLSAAAAPEKKIYSSRGKFSASSRQSAPDELNNTVANAGEKATDAATQTTIRKPTRKNTRGIIRYTNENAAPDSIITVAGNQEPPVEAEEPAKQDAMVQHSAAGTVMVEEPTNTAKTEPANNTTKDNKKESTTLSNHSGKQHWFIDAGITPLLPVQRYTENMSFNRTLFLNNNLSQFSAKLLSTSIDASMAFSVAVRREFNKKITLGIGLQYLLLKENIKLSGKEINTQYTVVQRLENSAIGPILVNDTVQTVTEGTRNITATNSYHLYSIPVLFQYSWVQKRSWNLAAVGGVFVNISSSYQNEINRNVSALLVTIPAAEGKGGIGYDLFAGLRFGKTAGSKVEFFAMPSMRWNLERFDIKNSLLRKKINQAGLSLGISYKIK